MKYGPKNWLNGLVVFDEFLAAVVLAWTWPRDLHPGRPGFLIALLLIPLWAYLHSRFGLYDSHRLDGWRSAAAPIFTASTVGFLLTSAVLIVTGFRQYLRGLAVFTVIWIAAVLCCRVFLYAVLRTMRKRGVDRRFVCVIGSWENTVEMAQQFHQRPQWGLGISAVGIGPAEDRKFFRFPEDGALDGVLADPETAAIGNDLVDVLHAEVMDEVLIISRPEDLAAERYAIQFCKEYGLQCRVRLLGKDLESTPGESDPDHATWTVHDVELNTLGLWVKRCFDIALSGIALVVLSPLFALLAVLVKLSSPGPVFFWQTRLGLHGRKFVLVKFRTMVAGAESMLHLVSHRNITGGPIFKDAKDVRVTDIGRILRRFSLDELPQLLNVFLGDMSLVGPRPLPVHESAAIEGRHRRRFNMRPGITCHWQVQGRSEIGFARWMELDVEYVDNWSLREDMVILLLTIPTVLSGRGAY